MPTGVCSETEEAGDVVSEYDDSGVSGVRYAFAGLVGIDGGVFEYVSSQMTFDAIVKAEMSSRRPEEPRAIGKRACRRCSKTRRVRMSAVQCVGNEVRELRI
jgi:hypothetical protein